MSISASSLPSAHNAELARAEQLAEFARGHRDRTGLADARLSGCRQRVRERHRGVQRDIAFDLLQHLMDVSIQHRDRSERTQQRHRLRGVGRAPAPGFPDRPQRNVREHHDRRRARDAREIAFQPGDLFVAELRQGARLEVLHVVQADEMHAALVEAVPRLAIAIVIEKPEIAGRAVIDRVVFARNRMHAIYTDFLQHLTCLAEFLGLRQMAHVAGVHDEGGRLGQRVDVGDRAPQAADDVGIGFLAKADVRIADLHESQCILLGDCWGALARRAERAWHAAGNRPDDGGAGPGGETAQCLAAGNDCGRGRRRRACSHVLPTLAARAAALPPGGGIRVLGRPCVAHGGSFR